MQPNRRDMMIGALAAGLWPRIAGAGGLLRESGPAFGSSWHAVRAAGTEPIAPVIAGIVDRVDREVSPYRVDSALSVFNRSRSTDWQPAAFCLARVGGAALMLADATGGWFDPTVGPLVGRLGFGPIRGGMGDVATLDVRGGDIRKTDPFLTLDLCGIAKGYAVDMAVEALANAGVRSALIEMGGEVMGLGQHPDGRDWTVAIADPTTRGRAWRRIAPLGQALATSGPAVQGVSGRVATSHIVDPVTRRAAGGQVLSVSVLSRTAMVADALATALVAAGPEEGVALARRLEVSALFIVAGGQGPDEVVTGGFDRHFAS